MRDQERKSIAATTIIVIILILIAVICGYKLMSKVLEYKQSRDYYNNAKEAAVEEEDEPDPLEPESVEQKRITGPVLKINWEELGENCVGWLLLDKTINYPIMQGEDNHAYLHALPDGTYNYGGSVFLGSEHPSDFSGDNSLVYGHNMADGSMFGTLKKYIDPDYEDHIFYIFTPDGKRHKYEFFAVLSVESNTEPYKYGFTNLYDFLDFQNHMKAGSLYELDTEPDMLSHIVSLSTCNGYQGTSHRLVVQGIETEVVQIPQKEK